MKETKLVFGVVGLVMGRRQLKAAIAKGFEIGAICDCNPSTLKIAVDECGVPDEKRTARFVCAICVSFPDGSEITAEGACEGKIGYEYRGSNGFGYDPLFMVGEKSFAEFTAEEKDAVSHRGNALKKLKELLPTV